MGPVTAAHPLADTDRRIVLDPVATVKYMGSKRSLVPSIAPLIASVTEPHEVVLDAFAGTHVVGASLRHRNRIIGVDVQKYSRVLGEATLNPPQKLSPSRILAVLSPHLQRHGLKMNALYEPYLETERKLLARIRAGDTEAAGDYADFQVSLPDPSSWTSDDPGHLEGFDEEIRSMIDGRRGDHSLFPYMLLTAYYANAYFGIEQAITLDGIRYAIDQEFGPRAATRNTCLAALLSAASCTTSSPGHFAMWRTTRELKGAQNIAEHRRRDVLYYFERKLTELCGQPRSEIGKHSTATSDALTFVREYEGSVGTCYLDPPYSAVHYSRFYHVLEEIVDYDYPDVFFGGRFPGDRYSSAWSVKSQAKGAFDDLLGAISDRGWTAVISYGSGGVLSEAGLISSCQAAFGNPGIDLRYLRTQHSSMGRADRGSRPTKELVLVCRPRRTSFARTA